MTDGVTDDIVWIEGARITGSIPGLELKKKPTSYICIIFLKLYIYCIYLICILYILYIAYIRSQK